MRTSTNGAPRKTLESQIDRLDKILDGLADALQGAVTTAVTEAVREVVRETLRESVTGVMDAPAAPALSVATPRLFGNGLSAVLSRCRVAMRLAGTGLHWLWAQRASILLLLLIGLGVGWLTSAGSPVLAAVASGVGAMTFMLTVWCRQRTLAVPCGPSHPEVLNHRPPRNRVFADPKKPTDLAEALDGQ